jgi:hypothetical protein
MVTLLPCHVYRQGLQRMSRCLWNGSKCFPVPLCDCDRHFEWHVSEEGANHEQLNAHDTVQLTPCDGTATSKKWCCGDNTDCCAAGVEYKALYIPQKLTSKSSALSVAPAPVQNQTLSSNSTSNSTSSEPPVAPPKGLSGGAKAGIGIGVVLGVILSLAAGFFAGYMAKRHWKRLDDPKGRAVEVDANQYDPNRYQYENKASVYASHELNNPRAQEIGGSHHMIHELADQGGVKN